MRLQPRTLWACTTKSAALVEIGQKGRAHFGSQSTFCVYQLNLGFHWRDVSDTPYL